MQPAPPTSVPTADFGSRFSAFMIDLVLLFSAQWLIVVVASRQLQAVGLSSREPCAEGAATICEGPSTILWVLILLFLLTSTVLYHAIFDGRYGATPGKRIAGIEVVSSTGQRPPGMLAGTLRSVVRQAFWIVLFFMFDASPLGLSPPRGLFFTVILVAIAFTMVSAFLPNGLAMHDRVAHTQVVRTDQLTPTNAAATLETITADARGPGSDTPDHDVEESV